MSDLVKLNDKDGNVIEFKGIREVQMRGIRNDFTEKFVQAVGTREVKANGAFDVASYSSVEVDVPASSILRDLTNPATGSDISAGKQAYDSDGTVIYGTMSHQTVSDPVVYPELTLQAGYYDETTLTVPLRGTITVKSKVGAQEFQSSKDMIIDKVVVKAEHELKGENIKNGHIICGVMGTYDGNNIAGFADGSIEGLLTKKMLSGATKIRQSAFYGAKNLTGVDLPESVTAIETYAFQNCAGITYVYVPKTVTAIGQMAFLGCTALKTIYFASEAPPTLGGFITTVFPTTLETIYVPRDSVDTYKDNQTWAQYADKIKPYVTEGLTYALNSDSTGYIVSQGKDDLSDIDLVIPNTYEDLPVTEIASNGFTDSIKSVTLPINLQVLGERCFTRYSGDITIPASVKTVGREILDKYAGDTYVTFKGKPDTINSHAFDVASETYGYTRTVRVPWAEGEVAGAPWGATTVTYEYGA